MRLTPRRHTQPTTHAHASHEYAAMEPFPRAGSMQHQPYSHMPRRRKVMAMNLKTYRVFYHFYSSGDSVASEDPVVMNEADIYSPMLGKLSQDGDFIGLIDANGETLQVMYEADNDHYWIEVVALEARGSYGKYMGFDELTDFFKALPSHFSSNSICNAAFMAW